MRLKGFVCTLAVAVALALPARADTPEQRMARAMDHALQGDVAQVHAELLAILSEYPASPMARALLEAGPEGSLLQRVQALLPAPPAPKPVPPVVAQCTQAPQILDLSERILAQRASLPGFAPANFGGTAMYLWLHYANPDPNTAMARFQSVAAQARRPPRDLLALSQVWAVATLGVEQGFAALRVDPVTGVAQGDTDLWRQVILADDGATFFALLRQIRANPALQPRFDNNWRGGWTIPALLSDLEDSRKLKIARRAEEAGEIGFAGLLLASREKQHAYREFIAAHPENEMLKSRSPDTFGLLLERDKPLKPLAGQTFRQMDVDIFDVFRAGLRAGEADFLMTLLNQTGWQSEIAGAAREYLGQVAAGNLSAAGPLETNWLFLADAVASRRPVADLHRSMSGWDIPTRVRHYAGRAQATVDWMRALRTVVPYVQGQVGGVAVPKNLSNDFPWTDFIQVAQQVREGRGFVLATPEQVMMAVEILASAGRYPEAIRLAEEKMQGVARLAFYRDLAQRLDKGCEGWTYLPGQSVLLGGSYPWRF
ncbi:MAG: hypothetical protein KDK24_13490 [Pseudooceanicola sp.]|nr:hypothetical protein [Pseudooceanicola sp.]